MMNEERQYYPMGAFRRATRNGFAALVLVCATLSAGCDAKDKPARTPGTAASRLSVVVSILPQAWLVREIAGEHAEVTTVVEPGQSPETYRPSDAHVSRIMRADLYVRIGVPFEEGPSFRAVRNAANLTLVDAGEGISRIDGNPHIWLSPKLLERQADTIAEALISIDPDHQNIYASNLKRLLTRIRETDSTLQRLLAPVRGKRFFVYHPAWTYFADDYELVEVAIEDHGKSPHEHRITDVQKKVIEDKAKVIFVQPQIAEGAAKAIADAGDVRMEQIDPLAENVLENLIHVARKIVEACE